MTRYQRISRIDESDGELELWEVADYLNGDMGDYYLMYVSWDGYYLVEEDEEGDVLLGGEFDEEIGGDYFGATDEVADHLDGEPYYIIEFPDGNRQFAYFEEE